jgi:hypothetical protein
MFKKIFAGSIAKAHHHMRTGQHKKAETVRFISSAFEGYRIHSAHLRATKNKSGVTTKIGKLFGSGINLWIFCWNIGKVIIVD